MRWLKPNLRSSLYGLLGYALPPSDSVLQESTEDIREAMLSALGDGGPRVHPQLTRRIRYANDVQSLWYLRGDLMAALAAQEGEASARAKVSAITARFKGLVPSGLNSRPSPLDN